MNEAQRKRDLVAEVNSLRGGWAQRLEDRYGVGVLDLIIKLPDEPIVFAEGKMIHGNLFGPTERQWIKGKQILSASLMVVLLGWKGSQMAVSSWVQQADWRECLTGSNHLEVLREWLREQRKKGEWAGFMRSAGYGA